MGNQICWCYAEEEVPAANQEYMHINQRKYNQNQNISLQLPKKQEQLNFVQDVGIILNTSDKQNINCQGQNQFQLNDSNLSEIKQKLKGFKNVIINCNIFDKDIINEPQILLYNDPLSNIVSTWFQLAIAQPKYFLNISKNQKLKYVNFDKERINNDDLNNDDLQTLICLKWCVVDFFKVQKVSQNKIIKKCFKIFQKAVHYCYFFQKFFIEGQKKTFKENILLYLNLYQYYQRIMCTFANKYELYVNAMQEMYEQNFNFINKNNQYPFFKVIGYMMRFWCQIMLSDDVQNILEYNFKNLHQSEDQALIYKYVIYALDVNINEDNVHWIGHRVNFKYEKKLLNKQSLEEERYKLSTEEEYQKKLDLLKNQYPLWYFEFEVEYKIIKSRIRNLLKYNKEISNDDNVFIKQTFESEILIQSEEQQNNLKEQSEQNQEKYLMRLKSKNVFSEIFQSQDETEELVNIRNRLSNMSTEISYQENIEYRQKLSQLITDLININKKLQQREFTLQLRAKKYKLKPDRQIEWLNFFAKTKFDKIPDSKFQLKEYIKQILLKLSQQDKYYEEQIQNFI